MPTCVSLQNKIIKDERGFNLEFFFKKVVVMSNQQEAHTKSKHFYRDLKMGVHISNFTMISLNIRADIWEMISQFIHMVFYVIV
jgi:hypothetical protein